VLPAGLRLKPPQRGDHVLRIQAPRVIDIDVGQPNHAFFIDEKGGRHGQVLRAIRAVEQIERMAGPAVKLLREFVVFLDAQGLVRQLRRRG
jgi:hypothetical protein